MNSAILTRSAGTPTLRAALASPPVAKIQLPYLVRSRIQLARMVITIHQRIDVRNSTPNSVNVGVERGQRADSKPGAASMPATRTWLMTRRVTPTLAPRRMKKVARVTIKLGRPVLTTIKPLR